MGRNPLRELEAYGQSIWIDFIGRGMIDSGEIQRLIQNDGITGITSNPSIFEKAIAESHDYDASILRLSEKVRNVNEIFEILAVEDIQNAADLLRPVYDKLHGADGFVSLEVSPRLANDSNATITEARRLWKKVNRPNVMIKVPGTEAGILAIRELTRSGINVNVTLLFGLPRYRQVVDSYISGLDLRADEGEQISRISSVASFFLSRIDVQVDSLLEKKISSGSDESGMAGSLIGSIAIASAKIAYQIYKEMFTDKRFHRLADLGAGTQRLLWASTSTKNPKYSDIKYVEPLIGPDTINTLPLETLNAYRDHGKPLPTLTNDHKEAQMNLDHLHELGIDLGAITAQLEKEGIEKFVGAYEALLGSLNQKRMEVIPKSVI